MPTVGEFILIRYRTIGGPVVYHERLVLGCSADGLSACIVTPDGDVYVEECTIASVNVHTVLPLLGQGAAVLGIPPPSIYRFRDLPEEPELVGHVASASVHLGIAWPTPPFSVQLGLGNCLGRPPGVWSIGQAAAAAVPPAAPAAVVAVAPLPGIVGGVAGLVAALGGPAAGVAAPAPGAVPAPLGFAPPAVAAGVAAVADCRLLAMPVGAAVPSDFRAAVAASSEIARASWSIRGPRTTLWCMQHMEQHAGNPIAWHNRWMANSRIDANTGGADTHEAACRLLHTLCCVDGLNVSNLAAGELVARQIQLLEERQRERKPPANELVDSHLYMGSSEAGRGGACICPLLSDWIAEELRKESGVLKERRKAREERALMSKKGKGKGADRDKDDA